MMTLRDNPVTSWSALMPPRPKEIASEAAHNLLVFSLRCGHMASNRILATGSATVATRRRQAESGVGRWLTVPIPTLSFCEYLRIRDTAIPRILEGLRLIDLFSEKSAVLGNIAQAARPLLPEFRRYLLVGGFPETALLPDVAMAQQILREDVVERVLRKDLVALFNVRSLREFEQLFIYLCLHTGRIFAVKTSRQPLELPSRPSRTTWKFSSRLT